MGVGDRGLGGGCRSSVIGHRILTTGHRSLATDRWLENGDEELGGAAAAVGLAVRLEQSSSLAGLDLDVVEAGVGVEGADEGADEGGVGVG